MSHLRQFSESFRADLEPRTQAPRAPESGTHLRTESTRLTRRRSPGWHPPWRVAASPIPTLIFVRATGAIVAANDAAARAYGTTREELLESFISELVPRADDLSNRLLRLRHPETAWTRPLVQRRMDGTTFLAELAVLEAGATGSATMMVVLNVEEAS